LEYLQIRIMGWIVEFKDYYKILGVKTEDDKKAIKTAYRRLARKYHPDVSKEHDAEAQFKLVAEAYEVLSSDEKRAEYDQLRQYGSQGQPFTPPPGWQHGEGAGYSEGDYSDFFESIFGADFHHRATGAHARSEDRFSRRGQDIEIDMPIFLEDTLSDETKTIAYNLPHYGETGRMEDIRKTLKVKIPKGVTDKERIRLKGQGAPGFGNGTPGNLYLKIKLVPHPLFDVIGNDLSITVPVAPWEAALGASIEVPTLSGQIKVTIKPDSQSGNRLRIKGKGLSGKKSQGDLHVILKIVIPDKTDAESAELWKTLASKSSFNPRSDLTN
jgi:curved DNA-binding protein